MKKNRPTWKYAWLVYAAVVVIWIAYITMLYLGKTQDSYKLGMSSINILRFSFALPILGIWLASTLAAVKFKAYAKLIEGSEEGPGFRHLANGLFWLLGYMIALIMVGRLAPMFVGTPFLLAAVFIKNHLPVVLLFISLIELFRGSTLLADSAYARPHRRRMLGVGVAYLIFTTCFVAVFYTDGVERTALSANIPAFAVPHWALLFTLVLPSLIAWLFGILATLYLSAYARRVRGRIYQKSMKLLLWGIIATTTFTILIELLTINSSRLQGIGLAGVLVVVYLFILAYGIGSIFLARSAHKLTLIEVAE